MSTEKNDIQPKYYVIKSKYTKKRFNCPDNIWHDNVSSQNYRQCIISDIEKKICKHMKVIIKGKLFKKLTRTVTYDFQL